MSEFGIFAAIVAVAYGLPSAACFLWWDYDHYLAGEDRSWAFIPLVNLVGMVALTWWRIERGSEYGRLKQQLRRERTRRDLEQLRNEVERQRTARIRELEDRLREIGGGDADV